MQTCLFVDEAPVIRKVATRILLKHGLTIHAVATPDEARAYLKDNGLPDIALISASSSDTGGLDLVREICQSMKAKECAVLATIVETNLGLMTRLKRAGAMGYVLKPFDRQTLSEQIGPYLEAEAAA